MTTEEKLEAIYAHEEIEHILTKLSKIMTEHSNAVKSMGNIKQAKNILFLADVLYTVSYYFNLNTRIADEEDLREVIEALKSDLDSYLIGEL